MKQDLNKIKLILKSHAFNFAVGNLEVTVSDLRRSGAIAFADTLQKNLDQIEIFRVQALESLGEDVE